MAKRFTIIDGNSLINRAYYAMQNPMVTKEGIFTQGIFGFLRMLEKLEKEHPAEYMCVTFDMKAPTFRHKEFEEYKAGRKKMPPELAMQLPLLKDILAARGIAMLEKEGFEADDLIGTLAREAESAGFDPLIITGDKDALQLATDQTHVLITKKGISQFALYDHDTFTEEYGFTPTQFIDCKGLMGDSSDNIPGLPGVGEKTATKLIITYGSVENLLEHTDELKGKLKTTVEDNKALALMSKRLATIDTHVPIDFDAESYRIKEQDTAGLLALYSRLEFNTFIRQLDLGEQARTQAAGGQAAGVDPATLAEEVATVIADDAEKKGTLAKALKEAGAATIKTFGDRTAIGTSRQEEDGLTGLGLLIDKTFYYVNIIADEDRAFVKTLFWEDKPALGGCDVKESYLHLMCLGLSGFTTAFDAAVAQYVLEPSRRSYDLSVLAKDLLQYGVKEEKAFAEEHAQITLGQDLTADFADYAKTCCIAAYCLAQDQQAKLEEEGLTPIYEDVELPLIEVMASMEFIGFPCDAKVLQELGGAMEGTIDALTNDIYDLAGEEFNIKSPAQLGPILFEKLELPAGKKTKKGYSTSADVLEKIQDKHPIVPKILEYRSLTKLMGTYIEGLIPLIREDGRIHAHFNQTITATGRISSSDPNLQNIPVRQELGRQVRRAFVPEEGCLLMGADYSQIELRVLAHMSGDEALIGSFKNGEDIHRATAARVLGIPEEEITPLERSRAKAVNFGVIYGMSAFGLSSNLDITRKEAEQYIKDYFAGHPKVKSFMDEQVQLAKDTGAVSTILGRKRHIPEIKASNYMVRQMGERLAMNSPIQGSAADIIKIAMVKIYEALKPYKSNLILQVHDELIINTDPAEEAAVKELLIKTMEGAMALAVDLKVDLHEGDNWYVLK